MIFSYCDATRTTFTRPRVRADAILSEIVLI
jgi:hypothetical protein